VAARRRRSSGRRKPIKINPKNKGVFTRKAKAAGRGVQAHANAVLRAPKGRYSAKTRQQAAFAKNFGGASKRRARRRRGR
jgi:hypothetical protein